MRFAILIAAVPLLATGPPPAALAAAGCPDRPDEVARIRAHLERAERELAARDLAELTPAQRAARAEHLDRLRAYRERGRFPHNHEFPDDRRPAFVDAHGTACAMAHLIAASGRRDLVERVATAANHARVPELAGDAELATWLEANGLTLDEAARVQPAYDPYLPVATPREEFVSGTAVTIGTFWLTAAGIAMNHPFERARPRAGSARVYGFLSGFVGVVAGIAMLSDDDFPGGVAAAQLGAGVTAIFLSGGADRIPGGSSALRATPVGGVAPDGSAVAMLAVRF